MGLDVLPPDSVVTQINWAPIGPRVQVWTDPWITGGPTASTLEWEVHYALFHQNPVSISIAAGQIRLVNPLWVNQGQIQHVVYTKGPVPYLNALGGELQSFDLPFPFP